MSINCAIIGPGNIGTDLMYKLLRSDVLDPVAMVGIDTKSEGLTRAKDAGLVASADGVDALLELIESEQIRLVFDATSAHAHAANSLKLQSSNITMIDLTPAALGPFCIPPVNIDTHVDAMAKEINMVTCGGQATIPMVYAVSRIQPVQYAEIVATVSSKSAGPGTRQNIDEFTRTTAAAVAELSGAQDGKAIIILNPAEPPLIMRDTIHCLTEEEPDEDRLTESVAAMETEVQKYVPGFRIKNGPVFDGRRVSVFLEVEGNGDYLPKYAGNLDIMTAAAVFSAECIARRASNSEQKSDV